ncbi:MAG: carboxypeptidase-like regulatory domain-containing protein, partial [Ferruginibacter sp.]
MSKRLVYGSIYMLCLLSVLLFSCKKNPDNSNSFPGNSFPIPISTPLNGGVSGRVIDENNAPVASATIECAGLSTMSDADGFFNFNNATLDKYISTVTVSKAGYFKGYRSFSAEATRNFVNIKLIPKILSGTISSSSGGSIILSNATEINFQQNSLVNKSTGAAYNGTVNVFASYIDPTSDDIAYNVPGSFMGRDANNLYSLQSTGMIAVDIESTSGEALQLATNLPATIKLPIPSSLTAKAPANIDTWSLDEQGVWKKENIAVKVSDHYEFLATHFSFWNADIPNNAVLLTMHVQDANGNSMKNTLVTLTIPQNNTWSASTHGITDELGNVIGMVPAGVDIQLQILANNATCPLPLFSQNIGSFNTASTLTVTVSFSSQQQAQSVLNVSGTVNDCSGQPLQSGTALIHEGQYFTYASITNGSYATSITHCDAIPTVTVVIWDNNSTATAAPATTPVSGSTLTIPTATLVCAIPLNALDGIYQVTGTFSDATNPAFVIEYPRQNYLITNGPSDFIVAQNINGSIDPGIIFFTGAGGSFYGGFGLQASFNLTSNTINEMHNYYGDPLNPLTGVGDPSTGSGAPNYTSGGPSIRSASLDPSGLNNYDPVSKV